MKKKYFLIILFLIFAIFLVGCGDKKKIEKVVDNYWLALSNQQYKLAKTYCVKDGSKYRYVEERKQEDVGSLIRMTFTPAITKWHWVENDDTFISDEIVITATNVFGMCTSTTSEGVEFLTKKDGVWKLK